MPEMNEKSTAARLPWMDLLRGVAIVCVILLHAVNLAAMLSGVQTPRVINDFNAAVLPYRMPMLFLLSGMLLARALEKSRRQYYLGKVRNLVWPYLVWVNVYWLVTMPETIPAWHEWVATSWLWYLFYLGAFFLIAPLVVKAPSAVAPLVLFVVSVFVPTAELTDFFLFAGYFFTGDFIWRHRRIARRFSSTAWLMLGLSIAGGLSLAYVAQWEGVELLLPMRRDEILYVPLTVLGIGGLVLLAQRMPQAWSQGFRYLGRNSIVFYVIHFPMQIIIANILGSLGEWRWQAHIGLGVILPVALGVAVVALRRFAVVDVLFAMPLIRRRATRSL